MRFRDRQIEYADAARVVVSQTDFSKGDHMESSKIPGHRNPIAPPIKET